MNNEKVMLSFTESGDNGGKVGEGKSGLSLSFFDYRGLRLKVVILK